MSGHTPGPWSLIEDKGHTFSDGSVDHGGFRVDAEGVEQLCYVWNLSKRIPLNGKQSDGPEFGSAQGAANARLITAAPELLAFADRVFRTFHDAKHAGSVESSLRDDAKALIAAATGEQA